MNTFPQIYCISLEDSSERRSSIQDQLTSMDLPFVFFDAIKPDLEKGYPQEYNQSKRIKLYGYEMKLGEIGCYLRKLCKTPKSM
jgi:glycosyl transferase, family 25